MLTGTPGLIENQIKDWLRRHVYLVDKDNGSCKKIVLRQLSVGHKPQADVHTVNISSDPAFQGTEIADKVILEISNAAQDDANSMNSGVQTYAIYAYYTSNPNYVPRRIFRVAAEEEIDRDSGPSEPPNEKGLTAQLMRHLEVVSKNSLVSMGYIIQTFQKEVNEQRMQNREFLKQQVDMALLVQETMNDAHKRRIEEKQAELQVSVIEGVFEHLKVVFPIIANRLIGKEAYPEKMNKETYLMATLFETLTPEQQTTFQNTLKPPQLAILGEILEAYEKKKDTFLSEKKGESDIGKNKLLAMFEKRKDMVDSEKAVEITDERTKRIEAKAQAIKDRLKNVRDQIDDGK